MKHITEFDVNNKKVIVRCDLNVTIKDGKILNDDKIFASLITINYLIKNNAKVIIMSHLGKVRVEEDKKDKSLKVVYERLRELLPDNILLYFSQNTKGKELESLISEMKPGNVLLIENTRFEDMLDKKESNNNDELAKYWASLGDLFINDAFGNSHRKHASNCAITKYIDNGIGFLMEKELNNLEILLNPIVPFTVIMGGAKTKDKINIMPNILDKCNYLLLGGGIANTFLSINNEVGRSLVSKESIEEVKEILNQYSNKIIMPVDAVVENQYNIMNKDINEITSEDCIYDIGPKTIELFERYINISKTIFINGTVGKYEDNRFELGTRNILNICSQSNANVILGGGDALASSDHFRINKFYFKSTGGGATLEYIGTGKLACLDEQNSIRLKQ
ncbi:MAG: phosphoglycerate kinase [Bacilli bacterium]|nr:phosphoglycerate kinase [Bacilli bacterium]